MSEEGGIVGAELDFAILSGKDLVAKDGSGFLKFGKKTVSDPYVVVKLGSKKLGQTKVVMKTLNPEWNEAFKRNFTGREFKADESLTFSIFDKDRGSADDPMGEVVVPLKVLLSGQVLEKWHDVQKCSGCADATGQLRLKLSCAVRRAVSLKAHESINIEQKGMVAVGLGWDMLRNGQAIDLDTSAVAVSFQGRILEEESVYFAQLQSKSKALRHTGDEREGDEVSTAASRSATTTPPAFRCLQLPAFSAAFRCLPLPAAACQKKCGRVGPRPSCTLLAVSRSAFPRSTCSDAAHAALLSRAALLSLGSSRAHACAGPRRGRRRNRDRRPDQAPLQRVCSLLHRDRRERGLLLRRRQVGQDAPRRLEERRRDVPVRPFLPPPLPCPPLLLTSSPSHLLTSSPPHHHTCLLHSSLVGTTRP